MGGDGVGGHLVEAEERAAAAPPPARNGTAMQGNQITAEITAEITACFAGDEAAEHALVEACVTRAQALGAAEVAAFPPEHGHAPVHAYNADWCGLSDRL